MTRRCTTILILILLSGSLLIPPFATSAQSPSSGPYTQVGTLGRGAVRSMAWSPDGQVMAVGSTVGIWLYSSALEPLGLLTGHSRAAYALDFSPDGAELVSASHDRTLRVWEVGTQTARAVLEGHTDLVVAADWSPDGSLIASGSYDRTIRLWEAATGTTHAILSGHEDWVSDVAFSPDGTALASASYDGTVRLWDVASGQARAVLRGHDGPVLAITFVDDDTLVSAGWDGALRVWLLTGERECVRRKSATCLTRERLPHPQPRFARLAPSPCMGQRGTPAPSGGEVNQGAVNYLTCLACTPGCEMLAVQAHDAVIYDVAWSAERAQFVTASWDGTARTWHGDDLRPAQTLSGHTGQVHRALWSPDGARLATLGWDDTVRIWAMPGGQVSGALDAHMDSIEALAWSADGRTLTAVTLDGRALLWDTATGELVRATAGQAVAPTHAAINPDGTRRAEVDAAGVVRVFDTASAALIAELPGRANALSWSTDGRLAVALRNGTIAIWMES